MPTLERQIAMRLFAAMQETGAIPVEAPTLLPAETLLDLYGEDLRGRAYVTRDPIMGEMMLRPDFTVPVVQMHMENGGDPARYTYMGKVFRKQEAASTRPREYLQVGIEVFDGARPAMIEAEVFAQVRSALGDLPVRAVTGDIGVLRAAIDGLTLSEARRAALLRHIWRPRRFRALLERFRGKVPAPAHRAQLAAMDPATLRAAIVAAGPDIGLRDISDVIERTDALRADAAVAALPAEQAEVLDDILRLRAPAPEALGHLRDMAVDLPTIGPALDRLQLRLTALERAGIETEALIFEAGYGRSAMEYYDGFVFALHVEGRADLPPVATGGRYDALTAVLGQGRVLPAMGAVIRPGVLAAAGKDA